METQFFTGYFARVNQYKAMGLDCVCIARYAPKFFNGPVETALAPQPGLLHAYKSNLVNTDEYTDIYLKDIANVDVQAILDRWVKTLQPKKGIVLLCYEKSSDFCHRHILAKYCNDKFGMNIREVDLGQPITG
jgi:Protein of unknown function, DUF488.